MNLTEQKHYRTSNKVAKMYSRKWDPKKLEADKAKNNNDNLAQVAQM